MPLSANPESFRPVAFFDCPGASACVLPPAQSTFPAEKATSGESTVLDGEGAGSCCSWADECRCLLALPRPASHFLVFVGAPIALRGGVLLRESIDGGSFVSEVSLLSDFS
jgi:hypothetical protein